MKTASYFNIFRGAIFSTLLLAIFGVAVNVNAQQASRITLQKGFCASIGDRTRVTELLLRSLPASPLK